MTNDTRVVTRAEVAARDGRNDGPIWMIIKDSVYDVTTYVHEHPGGGDIILEEAGKDASKAYKQSGHTADADVVLVKYKIGELVEEEKHYDANGKKKKRVVSASPEGDANGGRSCLNVVCCGMLG